LFWNILLLGMTVAAGVLTYLRRKPGWMYALFMFATFFLGELIQVFARGLEGDFAVYSRIFQMAAFPMLFGLGSRVEIGLAPSVPVPVLEVTKPSVADPPPRNGKKENVEETSVGPYRVPATVFTAALHMGSASSPDEITKLIALQIAHAMVADICLLASPPGLNGEIVVYCGYDLIREEYLPGRSIDQGLVPGLADAVRNARSLQIPQNKGANSLEAFAQNLYLNDVGNFLAMPILDSENETEVLAIVIMLSPFSKYNWTAEDQIFFRKAMPQMAHLIRQASHEINQMGIVEDTLDQLDAARTENQRLAQANEQLRGEMAAVQGRAMELEESLSSAGNTAEVEDLQNRLKAAAESFTALKTENKQLKATLDEFQQVQASEDQSGDDRADKLAGELRLAMEQVALLQGQLAEVDLSDVAVASAMDGFANNGAGPSGATDQIDLIASIVQDLRQPMSSIIGYTDLLLSESVGILGALQRKFLDRVKASTDRMNKLVGDLIQMTALDSGNVTINPENVDVMSVLDGAINETSTQLREKSILLRVDVPDDLPPLHSDRDAFQQIVSNLVHNAGAASPVEGEVLLRASVLREEGHEYMCIEVTDSGEGIPEEDLPRVFSRLYRADNALIQGVGDTGVGLSIVKTLTETIGGRIWVESVAGQGSTFKVMVPLDAVRKPVLEEE
jgi:signal transduction histidine kinase